MYKFEKKKLKNILGKYLYDMLKENNAIIAGGSITSIFSSREVNDIDVYFHSRKDAASFIQKVIDEKAWIVSHTNKATLFKYNNVEVQVIHFNVFETVDNLFDTFDFTVCMGAFSFDKDDFIFHKDFLKHNAQRILKFNQDTAFPIISALRVQKYEEKGYKISKPEFLRILLTCMSLNIDNYEDLKEQMGGMYGVDYDRLLQHEEGEDFDLVKIIGKMKDLHLEDGYFDTRSNNNTVPKDMDEIIVKILGEKINVVKFNNEHFKFQGGYFSFLSSHRFLDKPDYYQIVDIKDTIKPNEKFYKFVKKENNEYYSFYDNSFKYKIGEVVIANLKNKRCGGLHCGFIEDSGGFTYSDYQDAVLIELELQEYSDIIDLDEIRLKKAKFVREVPYKEYKKYCS